MSESKVKGSVQSKVTKKGKEYLYTVIYVPHLGRPKWEATGLEAKGNIKRAEKILNERINEYRRQEREIQEQSEAKKQRIIY